MISVIFLIFTLFLVVIGGICGFRRGILKEGVRVGLWILLFAGSCFFIPQIVEKIPVLVAGYFDISVRNVEGLVEEFFEKFDFLRQEAYLILPVSGFIKTILVPFFSIVFFWVAGFISWIIYLFISLLLEEKTEKKTIVSKTAGLILGLVFALFTGAFTLYPTASISTAINTGDKEDILISKIEIIEPVSSSYDGTIVELVYKFTGTEVLGNAIHNVVISSVIGEKEYNIWRELPSIVCFCTEGIKIFDEVAGNAAEDISMKKQAEKFAEAFFSLDFLSDENKLDMLKNLDTLFSDSLPIDLFVVKSEKQVIDDAAVIGKIYDILKKDGVLEVLITGGNVKGISEETVDVLIESLYELSNADRIMPEFFNMLYATAIPDVDMQMVLPDMEWDEETTKELSEVLSVVYDLPEKLERKDSLTEKEKEEIRDSLKKLENNKVINQDFLNEMINSFDELP